ncbi:ATP-binding protein, partial [bacterium]|nr:ATP-binding protein [bacterium]
RSIRFRLTAWYASLLSALLIVFAFLVYFGLQEYLLNALSNQLSLQAHQISETWLNDIGTAGEDYVVDEINEHLSPASTNRFIRLIRPNGSILYQSPLPRDRSFDPSQIPFPKQLYKGGIHRTDHLLIYSMTYTLNKQGTYSIETAASDKDISATLNTLALLFAFLIPVGIIVAIGGGFLLMKRALRPVDEIATAAQRITSQNLTERLPLPQSGDEIQRLSETLNEMIGRLENSFSRTVQFTADASHELRTPLTILRGELEVALRGNHLNQEARIVIENVLEETERLSKTVESLMTLSRLDSGQLKLERAHFDLASLCKETLEQMTLLAEEKKIRLECNASEKLEVFADPIRVRQIVINLIDNAIKFTPPGGIVKLAVSKNGGTSIEVQDNGAGIPSEAVPHIFDRFYRVDKARSREQGGSGLGLAIVKSICDLHGASISLESAPDVGTRIQILFPSSIQKEK